MGRSPSPLVADNFIDMRPVKSAARRLLPAGSPLLVAVLGEPDLLALDVGTAKLAAYHSLVMAMRRAEAPPG